MSSWTPASKSNVEGIVARDLRDCTDAQRLLFERIRVPPATMRIDRGGAIETVFVVARVGDRVVLWEDVEGGFELATPDDDGGRARG